MNDMKLECLEIRQDIFRTVCLNKAGHLASSLSSVEILAALYFGDVLKYNARNPYSEDRDRFILSKGHAALALYYVLAKGDITIKKKCLHSARKEQGLVVWLHMAKFQE